MKHNAFKFDKRINALPQDIYSLIDNIDLLKSKWVSGAKIGQHALSKLKKSVLVTSTGASTRIEGSELSDEDVERLIRGYRCRNSRTETSKKCKDTTKYSLAFLMHTNPFHFLKAQLNFFIENF